MNINKQEFCKYAVMHHAIAGSRVDSYISGVEKSALPTAMTPYITEERELRVAQMDVFSRLMMDRIIFLGAPVDDNIANIIRHSYYSFNLPTLKKTFRCILILREDQYMQVLAYM